MLSNDSPILNILSGTSLLTDLKLAFYYRTGHYISETPTYDAPIALNYLQTAYIEYIERADSVLVWPSVMAPETATVCIRSRQSLTRYTDLMNALSRQFRCERYDHLQLRLGGIFLVALFDTDTPISSRDDLCTSLLHGGIRPGIDILLSFLPTHMCPERITSMDVRIRVPYSSIRSAVILETFFNSYPAVTTLKLDTDVYANRYLYRLLAENVREAGRGEEALLFPALDTLIIMREIVNQATMELFEDIEEHWELVVEMLRERAAIGKRVGRLILVGEWATGTSVDAEILRGIEEHAIGTLKGFVDKIGDERLLAANTTY